MISEVVNIIFLATTTSTYAQFAVPSGLRPDVTFGESNNRFDVSNILKYNERHFKNVEMDSQSDEYRRRSSKRRSKLSSQKKISESIPSSITDHPYQETTKDEEEQEKSWKDSFRSRKRSKHIKKKNIETLEDHVNQLANTIILKLRSMRRFEDFAYHDNMDSIGELDFEKNLQPFIRKDKPTKRAMGSDDSFYDKELKQSNLDAEKQTLLHYGFPIFMRIEGFLQKPL